MRNKNLAEIEDEYCGFYYEYPADVMDPIEKGFVKVHILTKSKTTEGATSDANSDSNASKKKKRFKKMLTCETCMYNGNVCHGVCLIKDWEKNRVEEEHTENEDQNR